MMIDRFLDGELDGELLARCRDRLAADPGLRAVLQEREQLRRGFREGRSAAARAPAGFGAQVIAAARRLPSIDRSETDATVVRFCQRLLIAAAAIVVMAVIWQSGVLQGGGDGRLQASPDEVQGIIDGLDQGIREQQRRADGK